MAVVKENIIEEFYGFVKYLLPVVNKFLSFVLVYRSITRMDLFQAFAMPLSGMVQTFINGRLSI